MSRYDLVINGNAYSVNILNLSRTGAQVEVNGVSYQVEIGGGVATGAAPAPLAASAPLAAPAAPKAVPVAPKAVPVASAAASAPEDGEVILAPMPGHILRVMVKVGEPIAAGDVVVVMEAMKMENEIKAHVSGVVRDVRVAAGQDVGVQDTLVVIGA